jgi:hypothetical protein
LAKAALRNVDVPCVIIDLRGDGRSSDFISKLQNFILAFREELLTSENAQGFRQHPWKFPWRNLRPRKSRSLAPRGVVVLVIIHRSGLQHHMR